MSKPTLPPEPFPGALSQRCVKCESAAIVSLAREISDGRYKYMATCMDEKCGYSREIVVDGDEEQWKRED